MFSAEGTQCLDRDTPADSQVDDRFWSTVFAWWTLDLQTATGQDASVVVSADGSTAEQLVAKLGDASYSTRQMAFERLLMMGAEAIPIVEQSLTNAGPIFRNDWFAS